MKIAVAQMTSLPEKDENLKQVQQFASEAAAEQAEVLSLPETFNWLGPDTERPQVAEPIPGNTTRALSAIAREHSLWLHAGSIIEETPEHSNSTFNTTVVIDPSGTITATYRKIHLFDASVSQETYRESSHTTPGESGVACKINGLRSGLSICFDLRFPLLFKKLREAGATVLFIPAAFTHTTGQKHWHALVRARAIENQCFVVCACQTGEDECGRAYYGHSMIVNPDGEILFELPKSFIGICTQELDLEQLKEVRSKMSLTPQPFSSPQSLI
jgi:predicted amidohydrolase